MPIITLTSDFGNQDGFVGIVKGVLLQRCPQAQIVDVSHEIHPGDVRAAAFTLANAHAWFPPKTVHLAIVDPGVGSPRAPIAIHADHQWFVGPDNGVLSWAIRNLSAPRIRTLTNLHLFLKPVSRTFHGRDVFAPVAAHLAAGGSPTALGQPTRDYVRLPWPEPVRAANALRGEVLHLDRFGNAITNIPAAWLESSPGPWFVHTRQRRLPLVQFYQAVPPQQPLAVLGSSGYLELAVNGGSAAKRLRLTPGSPVTVRRPH